MRQTIISRIFIGPASPTPPHLKTHKLSLFDQITPNQYNNRTFFFPAPNNENTAATGDYDVGFFNKSRILQESLSKALTLYYPFAGRFTDKTTVDCNDEGALFVESEVDNPMSELLDKPSSQRVNNLSPLVDPETMKQANGATLLCQFTRFQCGGVALSLARTHKLADMAAIVAFLKTWSAIARESEEPLIVPDWTLASRFPPLPALPDMDAVSSGFANKFVVQRFVFSATKVSELRAKAVASGKMEHNPSRVEVVLSLLWRCAMAAKTTTQGGRFKPSALWEAVNLRNKTATNPIPETTGGNVIFAFVVTAEEEQGLQVHDLATRMRTKLNDFRHREVKELAGENGYFIVLGWLKRMEEFFKSNADMNMFQSSCFCRFPLYEIDFGWGKPVWHIGDTNLTRGDLITLTDTSSGDGIEALVSLNEEEMAKFESDEELLQFASVNPSVIGV